MTASAHAADIQERDDAPNLLGSIRYGFQCMRNTDGDSARQSAAASLLQVGTPAAVFGNVAMPVFGLLARVKDGLDAPAVR